MYFRRRERKWRRCVCDDVRRAPITSARRHRRRWRHQHWQLVSRITFTGREQDTTTTSGQLQQQLQQQQRTAFDNDDTVERHRRISERRIHAEQIHR